MKQYAGLKSVYNFIVINIVILSSLTSPLSVKVNSINKKLMQIWLPINNQTSKIGSPSILIRSNQILKLPYQISHFHSQSMIIDIIGLR